MKHLTRISLVALAAAALAACGSTGDSGTRDNIFAVGSSTVYPFAKAVAESFARSHPDLPSPIIESTGTGGGMNLFCKGLGAATPDIADASRRMTASEFATCQQNGVTDISEIQVGLDGIAFAAAQNGIALKLTPKIIYEAIAAHPYGKEQKASTWKDVDASLPNVPILVYGPPSTSGTRDALKELVLKKGCEGGPGMADLKAGNPEQYDKTCTDLRNDGGYVDQGEQDNLIVQKIEGNPNALGVFGYSYLEENRDRIRGQTINGVEPTYENIASFKYPGARPLFIYVKKQHLEAIRGLKDFVAEWTNMWAPDGPLAKIGLVANAPEQAQRSQAAATDLPSLTADDLKQS